MKSAFVLSVFLFAAGPMSAHDTWLQATVSSASPGASISLQLTSGDGFKGAGTGPKPERVVKSSLRVANQIVSLTTGEADEKYLGFTGTPHADGIAGFAVELRPRDLELKTELIEVYFEEIHAGPALRHEWEKVPPPRRWRERYTKSATTFVRVGNPSANDRSWTKPAGLSLEIIPQRDPTTLKAGDVLRVQVLKHGKPYAGLPLGFVAHGETHHHVMITDSEGFAAAPLDHPGRWLVHGTDLLRTTQPDLEWESLFSTLVVEVAPAR